MFTVGNLLAEYLKEYEIKANQLALNSGVSRQRIHSYLQKNSCPDEENLTKLLDAMIHLTEKQKEKFFQVQKVQQRECKGRKKEIGRLLKLQAQAKKFSESHGVSIEHNIVFNAKNNSVFRCSFLVILCRIDGLEPTPIMAWNADVDLPTKEVATKTAELLKLSPTSTFGICRAGKHEMKITAYYENDETSEAKKTRYQAEEIRRLASELEIDINGIFYFVADTLENQLKLNKINKARNQKLSVDQSDVSAIFLFWSTLSDQLLQKRTSINEREIRKYMNLLDGAVSKITATPYTADIEIIVLNWLIKYFQFLAQ